MSILYISWGIVFTRDAHPFFLEGGGAFGAAFLTLAAWAIRFGRGYIWVGGLKTFPHACDIPMWLCLCSRSPVLVGFRRETRLGFPVVPFDPFLGEGSPTKLDYRKISGTRILQKRRVPTSSLSGGPRRGTPTMWRLFFWSFGFWEGSLQQAASCSWRSGRRRGHAADPSGRLGALWPRRRALSAGGESSCCGVPEILLTAAGLDL